MSLKREQSEPKPSSRQLKLRWDALFKDLRLLVSLSVTWLLIRRALRRQRKEHAARPKLIKLAPHASHQTLSELPAEILGDPRMLDLIFIATTVVFFLIALAYVRGCEKLQ